MRYGTATIHLLVADITTYPTTAIVTLINSAGAWYGGVDKAIRKVADEQYHTVPKEELGTLQDGEVIVANGCADFHEGGFHNVIFVIDDFKHPLSTLVYRALEEAYRQEYASVSFPLLRAEKAAGRYEKSLQEIAEQMVAGMKQSIDQHLEPIEINILGHGDATLNLLIGDLLLT